jgi:hypothetical protein
VDSISNQSHALDFGRELQKLHTNKMHFQQKVHAYRKIYPPKTRGSERDQLPEKEEDMVEERAKGSGGEAERAQGA